MKILYRVVAAVSALLIFPALWFLEMIHITIELPMLIFDETFSLDEIYINFIKGKDLSGIKDFQMSEGLKAVLAPLKNPLITTAVFLVLMLLMVIAVFICSAFTNARKVNLTLSLIGAASTIGFMSSFSKATSLIIEGPVGLDKIINALVADSDSTILKLITFFTGNLGDTVDAIAKLLVFQLTDGTMAVLFIFIFIALWTAAFILIDMDEYKAPKQKKLHHKKKHN